MDTLQVWHYKTHLLHELAEDALMAMLNQEGADGWELATIQAVAQRVPRDEDTLPGLMSHDLTGDYLVIFKKLRA
ncbi:MAG TPA: hypothetical protein VGF38_21660 [Ktedonobacterales bacterium]|jgi:hypothetical protein